VTLGIDGGGGSVAEAGVAAIPTSELAERDNAQTSVASICLKFIISFKITRSY
jgi:hypothetical protein